MRKSNLIIGLAVLIFIFSMGCSKQVFDGNRSSNDKQFIMNYSVLNRTETHEMKLEEGTIVNVTIENKSGHLDIVVAGTSGREIYKGNNAVSGNFTVQIPKTDTYKFSITGTKAKGSVSFIATDKAKGK